MATFLCSIAVAATLLQAGEGAAGPADALTPLRSRVAQDSGDAEAWFQLGQGYLRWSVTYHLHRAPAAAGAGGGRRGGGDTAWARGILDTPGGAVARGTGAGAATGGGGEG